MLKSLSRRVILSAVVLFISSASAATPGIASRRISTGLSNPVCIATAPGDTTRLFVCEQFSGKIRIVNLSDGSVNATPFMTISPLLSNSEQGLLGLAFDPNYASNGFVYVSYSQTGGGASGHTEISRFKVIGTPSTATTVDLTSKIVILSINKPEYNHNGGWIGFGPDGYFYISTGDGGGGDDQHGTIGNGQDRTVLLGKILRIDVSALPYTIPPSNPYATDPTFKHEIWAFGVRNPWRCSFDRSTGDLWIGDVGQNTREEIDFNPAGVGGRNYGWRAREGFIQEPAHTSETPVTTAIDPVVDYAHSIGVNAIIGGYVYRGSAIPGLQGTYIHADYGSSRFWALVYNGTALSSQQEVTSSLNPSGALNGVTAFGEDGAGEIYYTNYGGGEIWKIVSSLKITTASLPAGTVGTAYSKTLAASGGSPAYTWTVITGTLPTGLTLSTAGVLSGTPTANGTFNFTVQVQDATTATATQAYAVTINATPVIQQSSPLTPQGNIGTAYSQQFTATGGTLPLTWSKTLGTLPGGLTLTSGGLLSGTPTATGTFNFTIQVVDANGSTVTKAFALTINNALAISSTSPLAQGTATKSYSQTLTAVGGTPSYTWSLTSGALPAGITLSSGGVVSGTTSATGTFNFTATVTDSIAATASKTFALTINAAPSIQTTSLPGGNINAPYSQTLTATGGTSPLTWTVSAGALPAGVTLSTSGVVGGTPTASGTFNFTALLTDGAGATASKALALVISNAPSIFSTPVTTGNIGVAYAYTVQSGGNPAPTFSIASPPAGLSINATSGAITWTPTAAGVFSITVQATNGVLPNATQTFALTINDYGLVARPNSPPYLNMPTTSTGAIPATLSATGAFSNTATLTPSAALLPYNVNTPLWSDGAVKTRWISVPNGQSITFAPTGEWTFPSGTVFVKHFELGTDDTNPSIRNRLETRLIVVGPSGSVYGVTYKWNAAQTDADLLASGLTENEVIATSTGSRNQTWSYPSRGDCLTCHNTNANYILGVKTRQLNGPFTYAATGVTDNQIRSFNHVSLFSTTLDETQIPGYAKLANLNDTTASLETRARSYLDANCSQCHRPLGAPANFDARFDTPIASQNILDGLVNSNLSIPGAVEMARGNLARSIGRIRINTVGTIQMPPLARNTIDTNAVSVISAWIEGLAATPLNVTAAGASDTTANLTWTAMGDNESGFQIEHSLDGTTWTAGVTVPGSQASATDTGLSPATNYYFRVRSLVPSGDSAASTSVLATTFSASSGGGGGTAALPMTLSHLQANMKYTTKNHDTLSFTGMLPNLAAGLNPSGVALTLNVSGVSAAFTLDAKGHAKSAQGTFALQLKRKRDPKTKITSYLGGNVKFSARLKNGNFSAAWAPLGLDPTTDAKNQKMPLTVDIAFLNQTYEAIVTALYTGHAGKSGSVRK